MHSGGPRLGREAVPTAYGTHADRGVGASARRLLLLTVTLLAVPALPQGNAVAKPPLEEAEAIPAAPPATLAAKLTARSIAVTDTSGTVLWGRVDTTERLTEQALAERLASAPLTDTDAAALWELLAGDDAKPLYRLPVLKAAVASTRSPKAREALWSELASVWREKRGEPQKLKVSLVGAFERYRKDLQSVYPEARETESTGDEMVDLMPATEIFGANTDDSVAWLSEHHPAALARRIERERGRGKPVQWEATALKQMLRWKDARLVKGGSKVPRTLATLDTAAESFITIFNCLHDLEPKRREDMLRGLTPEDVFNAVVGGEAELYRLGTSSYRDHLHGVIMRGIRASGSFETFIDKAIPRHLGDAAVNAAGSRALMFLRVVSSFGLLEEVLDHVKDRERFIDGVIASLADPRLFDRNGAVVMDVLLSRANSQSATAFKQILLDKLYAKHGTTDALAVRSVYGSLLSVYQTLTGNRRSFAIDRDFPLDETLFRIPFDRLFSPDQKGLLTHRIVMRMDEDTDAVMTYTNFRNLIRRQGALLREERHFDLYRISRAGRVIEIYVNKPTAQGTKQGIADIASVLKGRRVETIVGRGHTSIITPLRKDAKRILADRVKNVSVVLLGTCGGDASVPELIDTFGPRSFFTTRATGRLVINNAIVETYVAALLSLPRGARLSMDDILRNATSRFAARGTDPDLKDDASFYRLAMPMVLTSDLYDKHVRRHAEAEWQVARR